MFALYSNEILTGTNGAFCTVSASEVGGARGSLYLLHVKQHEHGIHIADLQSLRIRLTGDPEIVEASPTILEDPDTMSKVG